MAMPADPIPSVPPQESGGPIGMAAWANAPPHAVTAVIKKREPPRHRVQKVNGKPQLVYDVAGTVRGKAAPGRNEPCPCGSGKKYKKCHGAPKRPYAPPRRKSLRTPQIVGATVTPVDIATESIP